jgi:Fis family transcriptional regulator, factor for inversion stimulation protein
MSQKKANFIKHKGIPTLNDLVASNLETYFSRLGGSAPSSIYDMVIGAVEKPMLEVVMREAGGNQSKASEMLGINRNTLRKKLTLHGLV